MEAIMNDTSSWSSRMTSWSSRMTSWSSRMTSWKDSIKNSIKSILRPVVRLFSSPLVISIFKLTFVILDVGLAITSLLLVGISLIGAIALLLGSTLWIAFPLLTLIPYWISLYYCWKITSCYSKRNDLVI